MQDRPLGPGWPGQDTAGLWRCIPASPERGRNLHSPHRCGNSSPGVYLTNGSVALSVVTGCADVSRLVVIGITELVRTDALPGGVGGDSGRAQSCFRSQLRQHGGEPDAEPVPARLVGGVGGDEPYGGLGSGVAAAEWRAVDRGSAGDGDDHAAWLQGSSSASRVQLN